MCGSTAPKTSSAETPSPADHRVLCVTSKATARTPRARGTAKGTVLGCDRVLVSAEVTHLVD